MSYSNNLEKAINILKENDFTCVLCKDEEIYTSSRRGIKPLLDWLSDGVSKTGFCAADKVVGKAAAFLYVLLGIKEVYADVISTAAIDVFEEFNIKVHFSAKADYIINRAGTGRCPMESAVLNTKNPQDALLILKEKISKMNTGGSI